MRDVMHAGDSGFGVLILLFGLGAAAGLVLLRLVSPDPARAVCWSVGAQGLVIAGMSLAPDIGVAFVGAVLFGGATSITLTAAMSALQARLHDDERIMAFAAFHTVVRGGLSTAAIVAGAATDALEPVRWPVVGHLQPARVVLLGSGLVTVLGSLMLRSRVPAADEGPRGRTHRAAGAAVG